MNRYKITKQLGDGTYGSVLKAVNRQSGEVVRSLAALGGGNECEKVTRSMARWLARRLP